MSAEGVTIRRISDPGQKERIAREILEALPDWFENVEAREGYIRDSREWVFFAAEDGGSAVGFLCLKETGKPTVELAVMGIRMAYHRKGIGSALFAGRLRRYEPLLSEPGVPGNGSDSGGVGR